MTRVHCLTYFKSSMLRPFLVVRLEALQFSATVAEMQKKEFLTILADTVLAFGVAISNNWTKKVYIELQFTTVMG